MRFIFTFLVIFSVGFAAAALLKVLNKKIWHSDFIHKTTRYLPYVIFLPGIIWLIGYWQKWHFIQMSGAAGTAFFAVLNFVLVLILPLSLLIYSFFKKGTEIVATQKVDHSKRKVLRAGVTALPLLALSGVGKGFASSFSSVKFPQVEFKFKNLPDALDGFKILHLSDLHLGYYFNLDHLEKTLMDAEKYAPHMVAVTGDIADDLTVMTDAMKLVGQLKTPFGGYASIGNHEYFRGIRESVRKIEAGPIPLLKNNSDKVDVYGSTLVVGGADDPVYLRSDIENFMKTTVNNSFKNAPSGNFRLLLSHRPRALDVAHEQNINLVLSGHTHAGQIGLDGKSFWEIFNENGYLWGSYEKNGSKLYTSAGMGHWFPFRLNCPLEAPVITLRKQV